MIVRPLILNATDPYLPAFIALDRALREALRAGRRGLTELYAETLDMHRFPRAQFDSDVVPLLRKKYHHLKVDVVAAAPIALDFAQRHLADIWPGAVIVFHSVPTAILRLATYVDFETKRIGPVLELVYVFHPTRTLADRVEGDPGARGVAHKCGVRFLRCHQLQFR